jgi:uncharacterized membrane protein YhaH (DUF805 family)
VAVFVITIPFPESRIETRRREFLDALGATGADRSARSRPNGCGALGVDMLSSARDGKMRAKLRAAILAGFNPAALDEILRDNDMFRHNVASGPDFVTRVNSLIDVSRQEGWLVELCGILAAARSGNQPVSSAILEVQRWLIAQRDTHAIDLQFQEDTGLLSKSNAAQLPAQEHAVSGEVSWAEFFFSFKGRISRRSFWLGFLTILIVAVLLFGTLALLLGTAAFELNEDVWHPTRLFKNIYWLMGVLLYWPIFALIVKRLHDFGQGRAFAWLFAILSVLYKISDITGPEDVTMATLAIFVTVLAMLGSVRGNSGPNDYGPDPRLKLRKPA